jgi:hypothetical protein
MSLGREEVREALKHSLGNTSMLTTSEWSQPATMPFGILPYQRQSLANALA